jgi:hypothetical protein
MDALFMIHDGINDGLKKVVVVKIAFFSRFPVHALFD